MKYLFLLLVIACAKEEVIPVAPQTDQVLQRYVNQFYADAADRSISVSQQPIVRFATTFPDEYWRNNIYSTSYKINGVMYIDINRNMIDSTWPGRYRSSVYREMAHILLGTDYQYDLQTMHSLIMNTQFCPCEDDGILWATMLDKLFYGQ